MSLPPSSPYFGLTGWPNGLGNSAFNPATPYDNSLTTLLDENGFIADIFAASWTGGTVKLSYDAAVLYSIVVRSI